ncbi:hypothetical protein JVT61DRAFT_5662 [Boletus reticuloceps]|uniref:Uncharacterized protein n=1 Tax=Boletus reticuloceps TaxID=495285 RepID=A0A8I3AFA1_9AGAM|nr:hypothetical protein JVT61DRAFT_5662 [Boletus reticuloceps]
MGWQKTFSLPKRSKGCHLITDHVLAQISEGIKDVKVKRNLLLDPWSDSWNAISLHVGEDRPE